MGKRKPTNKVSLPIHQELIMSQVVVAGLQHPDPGETKPSCQALCSMRDRSRAGPPASCPM